MRFSRREKSEFWQPWSTLLFTPGQIKDWFCKLSLHPLPVSRDLSAAGTGRAHLWSKEQSWGARRGWFVGGHLTCLFSRFSLWRKLLTLLFAQHLTHLQWFSFRSQEVRDEGATQLRLSAVFTLGHFSSMRNSPLPITQVAGIPAGKAPAFRERR